MFPKAKGTDKKLKLLLWGPSGTGKTVLSLQFPGVCLIDADRGSDHYADEFDFGIERPNTFTDVMKTVEWLATGKHDFRTVVIDQMSWIWDSVQEKWRDALMAKRKIRDPAMFSFAFGDWKFIKGEHKLLIRRLHQLDMNVILIARSKTEYSDTEMAKAVGDKPDCENNLPYEVDTVCQLRREVRTEGAEFFFALQSKDRTHKLPKTEFEFSAEMFLKLLGPKFDKPAGGVELIKTEDQIEEEKVERAGLIVNIKQISDAWNPSVDGSWDAFKERAIGVLPGNVMTIEQLRTLSDAIIEKLSGQGEPEVEPEPETSVEQEPKDEPPAITPSSDLTKEQNRVGWDEFNKLYTQLCGSKTPGDLSDLELRGLIAELNKLPNSLAKMGNAPRAKAAV